MRENHHQILERLVHELCREPLEDAERRADHERLPAHEVVVPDAGRDVDRERFREEGHQPVEQIHVRRHAKLKEGMVEVRKLPLQENFEDRKANAHLVHVHAEEREEVVRMEQVRQRDERLEGIHGEEKHRSQVAHALHVANVWSVEHVRLENISQLRLERPALVEEPQLSERAGKILVHDSEAALGPEQVIIAAAIRTLPLGFHLLPRHPRVLAEDVVHALRDSQLVADALLPHVDSEVRWDASPAEVEALRALSLPFEIRKDFLPLLAPVGQARVALHQPLVSQAFARLVASNLHML
mmetsp:Transcript_3500/g.7685  ORF Transcript_3500/g.7685 Transcript_3500/m.7685 type:complete len:299 (-) Transcript_3500:653-1549(-)